jgi:hypothetical protein
MVPGENKSHRKIAKTEFSQQGRKGHKDESFKMEVTEQTEDSFE